MVYWEFPPGAGTHLQVIPSSIDLLIHSVNTYLSDGGHWARVFAGEKKEGIRFS